MKASQRNIQGQYKLFEGLIKMKEFMGFIKVFI